MRIQLLLSIVLTFYLTGCGKTEDTSQDPVAFQVELKLPTGLTKTEARYQNFMRRAEYLELGAVGSAGGKWTQRYEKSTWDYIRIPTEALSDEGDRIRIQAAIWDKDRNGVLRKRAVLLGSKSEKREALKKEGTIVSIKLTLQVSVSEWD